MIRAANNNLTQRRSAPAVARSIVPTIDPAEIEPPAALALNAEERAELRANEETIVRGARAWLDIGCALTIIRDKRLYRETHDRLEDYCFEKFGLRRSTAYGFMDAFKRHQLVAPIASKLRMEFTAESQMRPLCRCKAVDLPAVLKAAAKKIEPDEAGKLVPTRKILDEAVNQMKGGRGASTPSATAPAHAKRGAPDQCPPSRPAAADVIPAMPEWSDVDLLAVARAMAGELKTRGLIKNLDGV